MRLKDIAAFRQAGLSIDDIEEIFALEAKGFTSQRECATLKLQARLVELERARHQAEQLLEHFSAERVVAIRGDAPVIRRAALMRDA